MPIELKGYQQRCLDELARYLKRTRELDDADVAFYEKTRRTYQEVEALPGLPYVCLRVPTGGGKTFMAAHAVGIAAKELLCQDRCLVFWLAPTTQIVGQTLAALRDKRHFYRQALDEAFDGCVTVLDLKEALSVQPGTLQTDTVVIVSTMQAPRVEDTEGRRIYAEDNGQLMPHFSGLSAEQTGPLEKTESGRLAYSLANVLKLHRPVVIVDEAHNARTPLAFDVLARFAPSCILEFTATPEQDPKANPSNVLTHVSAAELKAEEMIKLPIRLETRPQWNEAVTNALAKQSELETIAKEEEAETGAYVRPIVLFQSQQHSKDRDTITYEVLKQSLMEDFSIPEEQIAIATGAENEIEDVDILARDEPIRFIITVAKLREGWDCPFAYVLCSVSELRSAKAVEQILGRILRMPYAKRREHADLNHAYAYVTSHEFAAAANALTDALIESGFERFEARNLVRPETSGELPFPTLFTQRVTETVSLEPDFEPLPRDLRDKVEVKSEGEKVELVYDGPAMTDDEATALEKVFEVEDDKKAVKRLCRKSRGQDYWPAAMGEVFKVPRLAVRSGDGLDLFEDQFREVPWKLSESDASLSESEFALEGQTVQTADVDVTDEGKIMYRFVEKMAKQLSLLDLRGPKTEAELVVWLDRSFPHPDITQTECSMFLRRLIQSLMQDRGYALEQLLANRFRLRDVVERKIADLRATVADDAYQGMLLPDADTPVEVDPAVCFEFPLTQYPAPRVYQGRHEFNKHYYQAPAAMNDEEADCAAFIDSLPEVRHWVRNLERPDFAFWLPLPDARFYPDFVAELKDGRFLVVEYKGAHLYEGAAEKRQIGEIWEARSNGRCLFVMPTEREFDVIAEKIGG